MFTRPLVIIDVETTGSNFHQDRIIEIGAIRYEEGRITHEFESLLNPGFSLPADITHLTGITEQDLFTAPDFNQIRPTILELLKDATFVAHNARFDYGFVRAELRRLEIPFQAPILCTVELSRNLFPQHSGHSLDHLMKRHHLTCTNRHRALGDAQVVYQFIKHIQQTHSPQVLDPIIKRLLKKTALPAHLQPQFEHNPLPHHPGIYLFHGQDSLLYIGKSIDLKDRVLSHFSQSISSPRELAIASQTLRIEIIPTAGDLSAQILESRLIKQLQPLYNRRLRTQHRFCCLALDQTEPYHKLVIHQHHAPKIEEIPQIALFRTKRRCQTILTTICHQYELCPKLIGLESSPGACFNYHLGTCKGACMGQESAIRHNLRLVEAFTHLRLRNWPFPSPISITEQTQDQTRTFIVDRWHLIAEQNGEELSTLPIQFDLDTYQILLRWLKKPAHYSSIKPFEVAQLPKTHYTDTYDQQSGT